MAESEVYLGIKDYKVIGTRPVRHDGVDKVTGRAIYGADVRLPGLLQGHVVRSPHAHARIKKIDTRKALAHPGVKAVITGKDFRTAEDHTAELGEGAVNIRHLVGNVMAQDKVYYQGQPVAAVAATSVHAAREAADLITVTYRVLQPVMDVREAMDPGAPLLHDDLFTDSLGETSKKPSNVVSYFQHKSGNVEQAFKDADVVVERDYETATVHQGYIEPQNATAMWNEDGRLTVWCSTQGAFPAREQTAQVLGIPVSRVRVIPTEIGGGFGGKIRVYLEPVAALLSQKSGHPVKLVMDRADVLRSTGPTPGSYIRVKMGATKAGKITAAHAYMVYEAGGYPGGWAWAGAGCIFAPYSIPNTLIDGYDVVVNKPQTSAYRAPGASNAAFASETVVDELAEKLGLDPMAFRLKNASREGTRRADGPVYPRIGCEEVMKATMAHPHYKAPLKGANRGRGVAMGFWFNAGLTSSVTATVNPDGAVTLVEGSTDIGGTRTSIAMQLAEVLGIGAEDVKPMVADTDSIGHTDVTGGSRTTFATGYAAYLAAVDIRTQMASRAARLWEISEDDIAFEDGTFRSKSDSARSISFKELASKLDDTGGVVTGRGTISPPGVGGAFASLIVDVEVDPDTGKTDVLRCTIVQDAGKAIHPSYVEGQMQGGVAQGIGWALNEEYFYNDKGELANASFLDYRVPTCLDMPMIETIIVEVPNPGHPFGVRGVGEVPIVPPPAAMANAIYRATGSRLNILPMTPGLILASLANGNGRSHA